MSLWGSSSCLFQIGLFGATTFDSPSRSLPCIFCLLFLHAPVCSFSPPFPFLSPTLVFYLESPPILLLFLPYFFHSSFRYLPPFQSAYTLPLLLPLFILYFYLTHLSFSFFLHSFSMRPSLPSPSSSPTLLSCFPCPSFLTSPILPLYLPCSFNLYFLSISQPSFLLLSCVSLPPTRPFSFLP